MKGKRGLGRVTGWRFDLADLHDPQLSRVLRLEVEGVKVEISGVVAITEGGCRLIRRRVHLGPSLLDAEELSAADADGHHNPQPIGQLRV